MTCTPALTNSYYYQIYILFKRYLSSAISRELSRAGKGMVALRGVPAVYFEKLSAPHHLLHQVPPHEHAVVEHRHSLLVQPLPLLPRPSPVDHALQRADQPAERLLQVALLGRVGRALSRVAEGHAVHLHLAAEDAVGQLEVGSDCLLDEALGIGGAYCAHLREVGSDELSPVQFAQLQRALLLRESSAAHQVVDHHLVQHNSVGLHILRDLWEYKQQFHLSQLVILGVVHGDTVRWGGLF
jgi:hypothetical protein